LKLFDVGLIDLNQRRVVLIFKSAAVDWPIVVLGSRSLGGNASNGEQETDELDKSPTQDIS
jgi:hypothetical protein